MVCICYWCNERPSVYQETGGGCDRCPTIPYPCTCDVKGEPHKITCERSPHFSGIRVYDEERERYYGRITPKCLGEDGIEERIKSYMESLLIVQLDRFKIIKCEQDAVDPNKFTVDFEWIPE